MSRKYLIVASKNDKAGMNITTQLSQFGAYDFYFIDGDIIQTQDLDLGKINQYDYIIFASCHKSEKKEKTLCIHSPGNWKEADLGGESQKICKTSALLNKFLFEKLHDVIKEHPLDYQLTMEATHHGPLIEKPCSFIEIGSTETEWKDARAGFVVAKTIHKSIQEFEENPYHEIAFAVGGPHYCPNFNKIQLNSNVAISHVIAQYALPLTDDMVKEVVAKTEEEIDFALLDWKGIGNAESRKQILEILDKNYIRYKKTSEIGK
jgi:D-aminoacyl-tRNA deacylase